MTNFIDWYLTPLLPLADFMAAAGLNDGLAFIYSLTITLGWPAFVGFGVLILCERRAYRRFVGGE